MTATAAWIMEFSNGSQAAVGDLELVHVLPEAPDCFPLPGRPDYCHQVFLWEHQLVPLFDPGAYPDGAPPGESGAAYFGIVRYRPGGSGRPSFGALALQGIPRRVEVADDLACALPDHLSAWWRLVISCFMHDGQPVPVLDIARIFDAPLSATA